MKGKSIIEVVIVFSLMKIFSIWFDSLLKGMDVQYLAPSENDLKREMKRFTNWVDRQFEKINVDQSVDHRGVANH